MKICTIIGARPQFVKATVLSAYLANPYGDENAAGNIIEIIQK